MIGIDLVNIDRIKKTYNRFDNLFLDRFLNIEEKELCRTVENIASMWAIKEATAKALGVGISNTCKFKDIIITKTKLGAPKINLTRKIMQEFDIKNIETSVSHDGGYVVAVVQINTN